MSRSWARPVWAGLLAVVAVGWVLAAIYLWQTRVPGDLSLPKLDEGDFIGEHALRRASRFELVGRLIFLASQMVLLLSLAAYAWRGGRFARESAAGRIGTGMLLGMLGLAIVWIAQVPFGLLGHWWQRRYGVARGGYLEWAFENWLALGSEFLFVCLALLIVMALARPLGNRWWVLGGPAFIGVALLFAFVYPYLIPELKPLHDPALAADARELAREVGATGIPVEVEEVHDLTTAPNAMATGLGPSRRVILWDTLIDGRFGPGEVRFVLAHEFAHHAREHIWKSVAWYALFAVPGAYLLAAATRRKGGMADPRAVPLSLFVLVALQLAAMPLQNVIVRRLEAEADWTALEATEDPRAASALFRNFTSVALSDPDPPTWAYVLLDSHPTTMQRIAMARAWQARQARGR